MTCDVGSHGDFITFFYRLSMHFVLSHFLRIIIISFVSSMIFTFENGVKLDLTNNVNVNGI